jgi:nucleoid DNA-binding protein
MNRTLTEIADKIYFSASGQITRKNINFVVNCCFNEIAEELLNSNRVMITNFGKFKRTKHNSISFIPANKIKTEIKQQNEQKDNYN